MATFTPRKLLVSVIVLAVAAGGWWWSQSQDAGASAGKSAQAGANAARGPGGGGGNPWMQPVPVRVIAANTTDLKVQIKAIGTVTPLNTVVIQSRVSGPLVEVLFQEGQKVTAGDLLAKIDAAPYQVKLAQAQGQQQQNLAQLQSAENDLALYNKLKQQSSISAQQYNQQQALVNQLKGALKSNQAQIDAAELELSYTQIQAPISGRLGLRRVDPGNLVQANSAEGLVTITQSSPISVQFTIPETQLQQVRSAFQQGAALTVEAWDRSEQQLISTGELTTFDNQIDLATGTLKLKALFAKIGRASCRERV